MLVEIEKVHELHDAIHKYNIPEGHKHTGQFIKFPVIGEVYWIGNSFKTSVVTEIIDNNHFRTLNSIYKFTILAL